MKNHYFTLTLIFAACLAAIGCKKDNKCKLPYGSDGAALPDECFDCQCFAPSDAKLSWTDYNSVSEMHASFNNHDSTLMQHAGDTIRLCGWVYYPGDHEPLYAVMIPDWSVEAGTMFLVDNEDHHFHGNYGFAIIKWPKINSYMTPADSLWYNEHADFVEHFSDYLLKKWYVTARIEYTNSLLYGCCSNFEPRYKLVAIDTIN